MDSNESSLKEQIRFNWTRQESPASRATGTVQDTRRAGPERVFRRYSGDLQADVTPYYYDLDRDGTIVDVGCWMHARRRFFEARGSDPTRAHVMLAWVAGLYQVEEEARQARKHHPD